MCVCVCEYVCVCVCVYACACVRVCVCVCVERGNVYGHVCALHVDGIVRGVRTGIWSVELPATTHVRYDACVVRHGVIRDEAARQHLICCNGKRPHYKRNSRARVT